MTKHVQVEAQDGTETALFAAPYYVALHELRTKDCEFFADERPVARDRDIRGKLAYVPPGCRAWGWMVPEPGPQSFTALFLDPKVLEGELSARLAKLPHRAQLYFFDAALRSTLEKIRNCLLSETPADALYLESLCTLAAVELCQHHEVGEPETGAFSGRMTRRVLDYIEQHLNQDVGLEELSKVASLSRFHFLRAFKRATNETPYQLLLRRRVERARELLCNERMSITEVALAVGFKNSSRLTAAFRRMLSCTPSEYRAGARR